MSQRDLVAELQAVRLSAPPELRERVRLIAAASADRPPRFTWRRVLVVALPVAAAIAATVVFTRPSHERTPKPMRGLGIIVRMHAILGERDRVRHLVWQLINRDAHSNGIQ